MQQLMDLTTVSNSYPDFFYNSIPMDNLLETIEQMFQVYNEEIVIIEGEDGAGKTNILKQFCDKYNNNAISVFIKQSSKYAYDPQVIKADLYNQIHWIITSKEYKVYNEELDNSQLNMLYVRFNRIIRNKSNPYYIVIDGLEDIPESENYILEIILDLIPFGLNGKNVKFLFSSNSKDRVSSYLDRKGVRYKEFLLPGFSFEQSVKFFEGLELSSQQIEEIRKICKGRPGDMFTVRRTLETGISAEDLLDEIHDKLPNLFEYEWFRLDKSNNKLIDLLAIISHEPKNNKSSFIAQLLNISEIELFQMVEPISFINLDKDKKQISFFSETYRKFISKKLEDKKNEVKNLIINHLLYSEDDESILYLPIYLSEAERFEELIQYLTPELFSKLLLKTQSLGTLSRMAQLGISASSKLRKDAELFRYGMQSSLIMENYTTKIWESEVKALISLNDYDKALTLTQSNALIEDRLHMLSIIARHKKEQGLIPDKEITEGINALVEMIDYNSLGEKALEIAKNLVFTNPELAIDIIERSAGSTQEENALDWAFANLSLSAMRESNSPVNNLEVFRSVNSKIQDPEMRTFFEEFLSFIRNSSADELLNQVKKYESVSDQIYILSNWCATISNKEGIEEVILYALNITVKKSEYAPNAGIYRKLSTALSNIKTSNKLQEIVNLFDSQINNIEKIGPTEDYIITQLNLTKAVCKFDFHLSCERFIELYFYISELEDISIKTEAYSNLLTSLLENDQENILEKEYKLKTSVEEELDKCIGLLMRGSAQQFDSFKGTIQALSKNNPLKALSIVEKINTLYSRDRLYFEFIKTYSNDILDEEGIKLVYEVINKITDIDYYSNSIIEIIESLFRNKEECLDKNVLNYLSIFNLIREIAEPDLRCKGICLTYSLIKNIEELASLKKSLLKELKNTWDTIDIGWRKVDIGFKIINTLSTESLEYSREFLKDIEDFRGELTFYDPNLSWSYVHIIRLLIRAYSGILSNDIDSPNDLVNITKLIEIIPSDGEQAILWHELAIRLYLNGRSSEGKRIVLEELKSCLANIPDSDLRYRTYVIKKVATSLFLAHKSTAIELLDTLPKLERDLALYEIANFIFTKTSPSDPYDGMQGQGYEINYEDVIDLCEIIEQIDLDSLIYSIISDIGDSIHVKQSKKFTIQQKLDIASRIDKLIEEKLPNKVHIQHDGYKIVSKATVFRIKQAKMQDWLALIEDAKRIPNNSDKALVLTIVATNIPKNNNHDRILELIDEVDKITETLPTINDKIVQYEALASHLVKIDQVKSKSFIKKAIDLSLTKDDDGKVLNTQKRLIDFAHKIDPEFAQSLVSITDSDPARSKIRKELKEELQMLELKKKMLDSSEKENTNMPKEHYVKASWKLLGQLNANRVGTLRVEDIREYIDVCANMPLQEAFPIYCWILENSNIRFKQDSASANQYIRPIFQSILLGADLSILMSGNNKTQINRANNTTLSNTNSSIIIKSGERELAVSYLRAWFEKNAKQYIKICDPYFGVEDLSILQLFRVIKPDITFEVLTSVKNQKQEIKGDFEEEYMKYWRLHVADQDPPQTEIVIVGKKIDGELPIHDRWILTQGGGLRLGTSFKSLGLKKDSEISLLEEHEVEPISDDVNQYLEDKIRSYDGERLVYYTFPL
ncbi:hypothetical protein WMO40_19480 [Bacillaceae bacterium CLA-AA-H227]|uniref:Uncharacterized protein n=1 Tax=Robertmurraya yapensis (ex Hitch et al 2024) TaxID=3133160 RepID=A0ACC6SG82_9BACI